MVNCTFSHLNSSNQYLMGKLRLVSRVILNPIKVTTKIHFIAFQLEHPEGNTVFKKTLYNVMYGQRAEIDTFPYTTEKKKHVEWCHC